MYLLLLFLIPVQSFTIKIVDDPPYDQHCIAQAVQKFFPNLRDFAIFIGDPNFIPEELLSGWMSNYSVFIYDYLNLIDNYASRRNKPQSYRYLIFSTNVTQLYEMFDKSLTRNSSQYIVITNFGGKSLDDLSHYAHHKGYVYIAYIEIQNKTSSMIRVIETFPKPGKPIHNLRNLTHCSNGLLHQKELLKPVSNNHCSVFNCKLKFVRVNDGLSLSKLKKYDDHLIDPWMETDLQIIKYAKDEGSRHLFSFGKAYNINVTMFELYSNITWKEAVKKLKNNQLDVIYGRLDNPPHHLTKGLVTANFIRYQEIAFIGKIDKDRQFSRAHLLPMSKWFWFSTIGIFILYNLFVFLIRRFHKMGLVKEQLDYTSSLTIFMSQSTVLPRKGSLRIVAGLWILFCTMIMIIFSCAYQERLINHKFLPYTFNDLIKANKTFMGTAVWLHIFRKYNDSVVQQFLKNYKIVENYDVDDYLADENNDGLLLVEDISLSKLISNRNFGLNNLYIVQNCTISRPIMFWMKRGHHYEDILQNFIIKRKGVGFFSKKIDFSKYQNETRIVKFSEQLNIDEFLPGIILMAAGLALGYVVLLIENCIVWLSIRFKIKTV